MKLVRLMVLIAIALVGFSSATHTSAANVRKLSQPVQDTGRVNAKQLSPNGLYVVYTITINDTTSRELYSVSVNDGTIVKLNGDLQGELEGFKISPDSTRVVYSDLTQVYSVPITGGTVVQLSNLTENAYIDFKVTPDSQRVVYNVSPYFSGSTLRNLYSVPITGGTNVQLNPSFNTAEEYIDPYYISPDSNYVLYMPRTNSVGTSELYKVAITGGAPALVDDHVGVLQVSPDSSTIVYNRTISETNRPLGLYHVPLTGGTPSAYQNSDQAVFVDFLIDDNSSHVVFAYAYFDSSKPTELYTIPLGGGAAVKISTPLDVNKHVFDFHITPDSSRVAYTTGELPADPFSDPRTTDLYSVPLTGGTSVKLNGTLDPEGEGIRFNSFLISPDSQYVVYKADQETTTDTRFQLYSVRVDGTTPSVKLNRALLPADAYYTPDIANDYVITPDSKGVLYRAETQKYGDFDLLSVPITGGASVRLNDTVPSVVGSTSYSFSNEHFQVSPNSQDVVFLGVTSVNDLNDPIIELFATKVVLATKQVYLPLVQR